MYLRYDIYISYISIYHIDMFIYLIYKIYINRFVIQGELS